jgi:malonate transporter and related proteins
MLTAAALAAVVIICAVPTAPSAYILATRMGGAPSWHPSPAPQTIISIATLLLIINVSPIINTRR